MTLAIDPADRFSSLCRHDADLPRNQALLSGGAEHFLITVDSLNEGVHFDAQDDPAAIGHKSLAVNLSDLAAMGATARWVILALRLPAATESNWIDRYAQGFEALAARHGVALSALSSAEGPMSMTVQAVGTAPAKVALRRSGAGVGDRIFVSGTLGDAACALQRRLQRDHGTDDDAHFLARRLDWPEPRLELGCALRGLATSAIDISDGLGADLGHIVQASGVAATLYSAQLPLSPALQRAEPGQALAWAWSGGDDYELCFTVPPDACAEVRARAQTLNIAVTEVGVIESGSGIRVLDAGGGMVELDRRGYEHFRS